MHRVPGARFGEFFYVDDIPEDYFEVTSVGEAMVVSVEKEIRGLVPDVSRRVTRTSLEYSAEGCGPFMRIKPQPRSLRVLMPGDEFSFVDDYGLVKPLPVPEFGRDNVEYRMRDLNRLQVFRDYLVVSLTMVDYFKPGDRERRDEFVIELTGGKYDGEMVDGKPNGKGVFTWPDGSRYEGSVVNERVTGKGRYIRSNGDVFEAYFVNGKVSREVPKNDGKGGKGSGLFTYGYIF